MAKGKVVRGQSKEDIQMSYVRVENLSGNNEQKTDGCRKKTRASPGEMWRSGIRRRRL